MISRPDGPTFLMWRKVFCALLPAVCLILGAGMAQAAKNDDGVAVIIGNSVYGNSIPKVDYAHRDADAISAYVQDVLGFAKENIIDLRDAGKAELEAVFGNERSHKGKLWRFADPAGRSDILVFYSGHRVPGLNDKRGYLLPTNAQPDTAEINGYSIDTLYRNLRKIKAKSRTVLLDACFSGESPRGMLIKGASAVLVSAKVLPRKSAVKKIQMTVITAANAGQLASWDEGAKQGLFTRHFLDGAYGKADKDQNGRVTLGEIQAYLDRNMTRAARRDYGRDQNVSIRGRKQTVLGPVSDDPDWHKNSGKAVVSTVPGNKTLPTEKGKKNEVAALQPENKIKEEPIKTPIIKIANLDGDWEDGQGLSLKIKGSNVTIDLVILSQIFYMESTIGKDGEIKQTYANGNRSGVIVKGNMKNLFIEFSGILSGNDREVSLRRAD